MTGALGHIGRATFLIPLALVSLVHLVALPCLAEQSKEFKVKAAFVYNFLQFVEFPERLNSARSVCVVGTSEALSAFEEIQGKQIRGRALDVVNASDFDPSWMCLAVYFSSPPSTEDIASLTTSGALLIGEGEEAIEDGLMIGFFLSDNKVRFAISPEAAKAQGIQISSKLLSLAKIVNR